MLPQAGRGAALAAVLLLLVAPPLASGQTPEAPSTDPRLPDLIAGNIRATGTNETAPTRICASVTNVEEPTPLDPDQPIGTGSALPFDLQVTVKREFNNTTIEVFREVARIAALAAGQQAEACWNSTLRAGTYRANMIVDLNQEVDEQREDNNVRPTDVRFLIAPAPRPDLQILDFRITPKDGKDTAKQIFAVTVRNRGQVAAAPFTLDIVDDNGLIGRHLVPALEPLAARQLVTTTTPAQRLAGTFTARAIVDSLGEVDETNETNNEARQLYSVLPHPAPDLRVLNASIEGAPVAKRGVRVLATIVNLGNLSAQNVTTRVFIDDAPATEVTRANLSVASPVQLEFFLVLPEGNHTVRVKVDPDGKINELDETNNDHFLRVAVAASPQDLMLPNLLVERLSGAPDDPAPDEVVNLTALVHNTGDARSNATTISFFAGARKIGFAKVPALDPDRYYTARFPWSAQPAGDYTVRALVDPDNLANESEELDNNHTLYFTILPPPAPREPDSPHAPPVETPPLPNGTGGDDGTTTFEPAAPSGPRVEIAQLQIGTRPVPGGVKGTISAFLRNPSLEPVPRMTITFKVDGEVVREVLLQTVPGAGTEVARSGEIDLPAGSHEITAEARIVGEAEPTATARDTYDAEAGEALFAPGAPMLGLIAAALAGAALRRRR